MAKQATRQPACPGRVRQGASGGAGRKQRFVSFAPWGRGCEAAQSSREKRVDSAKT